MTPSANVSARIRARIRPTRVPKVVSVSPGTTTQTPRLLAQAPAQIATDLGFEVVSLKPSKGTGFEGADGEIIYRYSIRPAPGGQRYEARNCPIKLMIQVAYYVKAEQIVGGPSWVDTERFDMDAKAEKPSSIDELHVMLMNMLVGRLHLTFHQEKREMPIYALTVDKGGAKLKPHQAANGGEHWIEQTREKGPAHKNGGDRGDPGLLGISFVPADG